MRRERVSGFLTPFPLIERNEDYQVYRYILMPELAGDEKGAAWRRVFYSIVLTSVEFFLAIIAILSGVPVLLDPFSLTFVSNSIQQLMPLWMVDLWASQLVIGGGITITGIVRGDARTEQIGVMLLLGGSFVYMVALGPLLPTAIMVFITYSLFTLAMSARYWVLGKLIKITSKTVTNIGTADKERG